MRFPNNVCVLTPKQVEIIRLAALAHTNTAIAAMTGVSRSMVARQLRQIYDKFGFGRYERHRTNLALLAMELGICKR